jgi:hypothetical protein
MIGRQTKAKRRSKLSPSKQALEIERAIAHLQNARDRLRRAGSRAAADYAACAMKSAQGALNHQRRVIAEHARPDTSDIPEAGEDWFKRARLVKKRARP